MMDKIVEGRGRPFREDRYPAESYEDILARDAVKAPDFFREGPDTDMGTEPIDASRYYDPGFFRKEVAHVWPKVWHWACREEEIPEVGDHVVYEFVGKSFIIVRSAPGEIKALYNACLHRGRQLAQASGSLETFRCPYHGMAWNVDGTLAVNPFDWDMPQWADKPLNLPEARVARWGGFVFMTMDPHAPPLEEVLGPIPEHFARYDFANRYKAAHVIKKMRANWKATTEAFMEAHHIVGTHPQSLPMSADINTQYDHPNDYVSRQFTAHAVQTPRIERKLSEQEIFNAFIGYRSDSDEDAKVLVPENTTARAFAAQMLRDALSAETGYDYSHAGDAEMIDSMAYNVFPHMAFWVGMFANLVYRFRPDGLDPEGTIMDILVLKPVPKDGPRPKPAETRYLGYDDPMSDADDDLGPFLANVFEQDVSNLPYVQAGLRALEGGKVEFTRYMEACLRRLHQKIDALIAEGETDRPE
ncbi:MAG: Rieske 2Fe-2S domain-containing protein [Porphyrobacter sp.]|nr:Rieske 2Fe-2S domain-containing protein [Porphyrobacter sp.]